MKLQFPIQGLHTGAAVEDQPPTTSPSLQNVRAFDIADERIRGGQRGGFEKAYTTQIGGEHPVLGIVTITTTYIPPA